MNKDLTDGEAKIVRALKRLDKLWEKHGRRLILFNGNSLRRDHPSAENEIDFFPSIRGEGGDGGDEFY